MIFEVGKEINTEYTNPTYCPKCKGILQEKDGKKK